MTALKWTFKSNKDEIYKLEKMESMEWQKQGSDALGDARQKLIHIRAPIMHYSEPYYSDGGGDDDSEMMMMVILTTWFMLMMMQTARFIVHYQKTCQNHISKVNFKSMHIEPYQIKSN